MALNPKHEAIVALLTYGLDTVPLSHPETALLRQVILAYQGGDPRAFGDANPELELPVEALLLKMKAIMSHVS